jgi:threonine/homoserine/homoserine lactone efflux protein
MLWWTILVLIAGKYRDRFNERALRWMDRIAGLAIGAFGVVTLLLSRRT